MPGFKNESMKKTNYLWNAVQYTINFNRKKTLLKFFLDIV